MPSAKKKQESGTGNFKKDIKKEISTEKAGLKWFFQSTTFHILLVIMLFAALLFGIYYLALQQGRIYIKDAQIQAPVIKLSSQAPGILDKVYVKEGDRIPVNTIVARVNGVAIKSKVEGFVISVQDTPGQYVTPQNAIVEMIDPNELRVVGQIQENKGLDEIKKGQKAIFTVDAFGSNKYDAVVDSISPAASSGDIVFSISDKRQEQDFDISLRYLVSSYPELHQGMSAKIWIYK